MLRVLKKLIVSLFLLCLFSLPAFAGRIDLNKYEIGEIPEELGMVQVAKSKKLGRKILEPVNGQQSYISIPCSMSSPLTVSFKRFSNRKTDFILISADGKKYTWELESLLRLDGTQISKAVVGELNTWFDIRLVVKGRSARLFGNDKFITSKLMPTDFKLKEVKIVFHKGYSAITDINLQEDSTPAEPAQ